MEFGSLFDSDGDGSEDEGTFYSLSDEFLEAARVLQRTAPTRVNFSTVAHYLLGHAAELMLKAFLFERKFSRDGLKKIGHNLEQLLCCARDRGLPASVQLPHLIELSNSYAKKSFEYRRREKVNFPQLDLIASEVENLRSAVYRVIGLT